MEQQIKIGDHVRSFDFPTSDRKLAGPSACFMEGTLIAIVEQAGHPRYEILVDRRVYFGKECRVREGELHYPAVNGTRTWLRKWPANGVELVEA